jgi:hypothetical protein
MRYFLDMNIPIYYCVELGHPLEKKAKKFINSKNTNLFLLCDYIKTLNLPNWIKRQKAILFEFNQKINNSGYILFSCQLSKELLSQDKIVVNRLLANYENSNDKEIFKEKVNDVFNLIQARVNHFIKNYIDEIVVPISEIDPDLRSCLFTWLNPNDSDARTIASAIQEHNQKEIRAMTADKKDWKREILEEVHNDLKLKKKYPKLPQIDYLQDF